MNADQHFARLVKLLTLESEAEARQALERIHADGDAERSGECLHGLVIAEETSGLGGRCILRLVKRNRTLNLPWNRLEPGVPVLLSVVGDKGRDGWRGVVCERD